MRQPRAKYVARHKPSESTVPCSALIHKRAPIVHHVRTYPRVRHTFDTVPFMMTLLLNLTLCGLLVWS